MHMNLPMLPIIKSVTDLRYQTAEIMKILEKGQPVVVTRENDSVAVLLSPKQYQQILTIMEEVEEEKESKRLESTIEKGGQFTDFDTFDLKQRKKLKLP